MLKKLGGKGILVIVFILLIVIMAVCQYVLKLF